ncbi:MAG: riboflavin biosynthesis protein RibF [Anaerolineae bacterium]|nr:riboflavin biosynthesis protein RibF [Anaerolineae bacterium]
MNQLPHSLPFQQLAHLNQAQPDHPTFVAVGVFDGVHVGHQALLRQMVAAARQAQARSAVLTFFPHPLVYIQQLRGRYYLMPLHERVQHLAELGVDLVITQTFDEQTRHTRAAEFIDDLRHYLDMQALWGGHFSLGYAREGDYPFLQAQAAQKQFTVHQINDLYIWEGERVSSSRIRQALAAGQMDVVTGCLGQPYRITGEVAHGQERGRTIGFPTANLAVWEEQIVPAYGVYATWAWVGGERYAAATNVGVRPTVSGHDLTIEAHLLDFAGDLYGQEMSLEFLAHIRSEQRFAGLEALKAQIAQDVTTVRHKLS